MNDAHQYLSALSAQQKAEEVQRKMAQLQAAMAPLQAEMAPLKQQMKELQEQLKGLKSVAAHIHGPDCGAACNPLETKSLPPEEEVKIGEPVPLEADADPEPSKERASGDPVWVPKMVKRRVPADPIFC